jgi:hypothetical protein
MILLKLFKLLILFTGKSDIQRFQKLNTIMPVDWRQISTKVFNEKKATDLRMKKRLLSFDLTNGIADDAF